MSTYIHPAEARRRFELFAGGEIAEQDLARGALLIALEEYPQIDVDDYLARLDAIAFRLLDRTSEGQPPIFTLGHLHAELFDVEKLAGNETAYYDPRNSYLNEVIDRKLGIPITLSIIYLHVAHRVGLNAVGVGLPGHYLVKVQFELSEVYIDPFYGGRTLSIGEIRELVSSITGGQLALRSEHLRRWTPRETLIRVLANLQSIYLRLGDRRKAMAAGERLEMLRVRSG